MHGRGALAGAIVAGTIMMTIRRYQPLQVFAYALIGLLTCFASGYMLSRILENRSNLPSDGLTIFSARELPPNGKVY